eukprot:2875724-Prymnesium_polylepis.1
MSRVHRNAHARVQWLQALRLERERLLWLSVLVVVVVIGDARCEAIFRLNPTDLPRVGNAKELLVRCRLAAKVCTHARDDHIEHRLEARQIGGILLDHDENRLPDGDAHLLALRRTANVTDNLGDVAIQNIRAERRPQLRRQRANVLACVGDAHSKEATCNLVSDGIA